MIIDRTTNTIEAKGLCIRFTYASSVPGPDCGGMATCDTVVWVRINGGSWYRPKHEHRGLIGIVELCRTAKDAEDIIQGLQGRKQFT